MTRRKIVFHLAHFRKGGIETTLIQWLRILDPQQYEIHLSLLFPGHDLALYADQIPAHVKITPLLPEPWLYRTREAKYHRSIGLLGKIAEELLLPWPRKWLARHRFAQLSRGADVVIDYDMSLGRFFRHDTVPLAGFYHFDLNDLADKHPRRYRRARDRFRRYAVIAGVSRDICDQARRLFPDIADRFIPIRNAFDPDDLRRRAEAPCLLPDGATPPAPWIVGVGTLNARKNFSLLLKSWARWQTQSDRRCDVVLVGDGPDRQDLQRLAQDLGLSDRVHFLGHQGNPLPWIAQAQLLVLTSQMEGLPTVLIEAQLLGTACASTDCPTGPREILAGGENGWLVPVQDEDALTHALAQALADDTQRRLLADRARASALEHFGPEAGRRSMDELIRHARSTRR